MRTQATIAAGPRSQATQEYWKSVNPILVLVSFERILEDTVPSLDQTLVYGRGAVLDVVELALLSPVAADELGASVSNKVNWHIE